MLCANTSEAHIGGEEHECPSRPLL